MVQQELGLLGSRESSRPARQAVILNPFYANQVPLRHDDLSLRGAR